MTHEDLAVFRDRFSIPINDEQLANIPFYRPSEDSPEIKYMLKQREKLGGFLPSRHQDIEKIQIPELSNFESLLTDSGGRELSTTMAFVRILSTLLKDPHIGSRIVPIIPDEARTFGMEGLFRQIGIYSAVGQLYTPVDREQVMYYREEINGQILEEGINEAGAFCSWMAAGTSYSNHKLNMIPFYIYYSMFGFQRIGDLAWAAGDMQAKGFLLGATAGRTTLAGEGLQHQDGHSHLLASTIPNCVAYDPTYAYELAVIIQNGLKRMYLNHEAIFYYITVMNENYEHPAMPKGAEEGILKGIYSLNKSKESKNPKVQLLGSGTILREVLKAQDILKKEFNVDSDVWSVTSFSELRREALDIERYNRMHPEDKENISYVTKQLAPTEGPIIAATDYMRIVAEQIRPFITEKDYITLGTDGYGRSDTRSKLRYFFEVNAEFIVIASLHALAKNGKIEKKVVSKAIKQFKINPDKPNPITQ